jgi:tetratricopeptide (TPR) repeat protein
MYLARVAGTRLDSRDLIVVYSDSAVVYFQEEIRLVVADDNARYELGEAFENANKPDSAKLCYAEIVKRNPELPEHLHQEAAALLQSGNWDQAMTKYLTLEKLDPKLAETLDKAFGKLK